MATSQDEQDLRSLGRDVEQIERELSQLEIGGRGEGPARDRATAARRLEAAARSLGRKLDLQSAGLWVLLQDPARQTQSSQLRSRIQRAFDRILALLAPAGAQPGGAGLADKVQSIQERCQEIAGHRALQPASLPHAANLRHVQGRALEEDTWSSLVVLAAVLLDFSHALQRMPGGLASD